MCLKGNQQIIIKMTQQSNKLSIVRKMEKCLKRKRKLFLQTYLFYFIFSSLLSRIEY